MNVRDSPEKDSPDIVKSRLEDRYFKPLDKIQLIFKVYQNKQRIIKNPKISRRFMKRKF